MEINEYQDLALKTASYPSVERNTIYPALKLAGESGEVADKIGKWWRNNNITEGDQLDKDQKLALTLELGDVLWYIAALAGELNISLEEVADRNIDKLQDRKKRNVIKGEGDNR